MHAYVGEYEVCQRYLTHIEMIPEFLLDWNEMSLSRLEDWLKSVNASDFLGSLEDRVPIWSSFGSGEKTEIPLDETVRIFLLELVGDSIRHLLTLSNTEENLEEISGLMDALELIPVHLGAWNLSSRRQISMCLEPNYEGYMDKFESLFE